MKIRFTGAKVDIKSIQIDKTIKISSLLTSLRNIAMVGENAVELTFDGLSNQNYTVTFVGNSAVGAETIKSIDGIPLDGKFIPKLFPPSGVGMPGGHFMFTINVGQ
jgi:hypothetical protein